MNGELERPQDHETLHSKHQGHLSILLINAPRSKALESVCLFRFFHLPPIMTQSLRGEGITIYFQRETKEEEKSYEKDDLFGGNGFTFSFDGVRKLRPNAKNSHHKEQSVQPERELAGVDDL